MSSAVPTVRHRRRVEQGRREAPPERRVVAIHDADGSLSYMSEGDQLFGYRMVWPTGSKGLFDAAHYADRPKIEDAIDAWANGSTATVTFRACIAGDQWLVCESSAANLLHHPEVSGIVVTTRVLSAPVTSPIDTPVPLAA